MKVVWKRMWLSGFGRFSRGVSVTMHDGLSTLCAPNEWGKSTLLAGLSAVLFGLPGGEDPERFGQGRFRSWQGAAEFFGELEFTVGEERYRVQRDFSNHAVQLSRWVAGQWREEVRGTHNPQARRKNERYQERLQDLLGMGNRELFTATFFLTQPLVGGNQLDEQVQRLVSGAASSVEEACQILTDELRSLTRFTSKRGVTTRDGQKNGQLEELQGQIGELTKRISHSTGTVDRLQRARRDLEAVNEQYRRLQADLQANTSSLQAWDNWRLARERYQAAVKEEQRLLRAQQGAKDWLEKTRQEVLPAEPPPAVFGMQPLAALERLRRAAEAALADWERFDRQRQQILAPPYEDLPQVDGQAVAEELACRDELERMQQQRGRLLAEVHRAKWRRAMLASGLALAGAVVVFLAFPGSWYCLLGVAAAGALGWLIPGSGRPAAELAALDDRIALIKQKVEAWQDALGPFADWDRAMLRDLQGKLAFWAALQEMADDMFGYDAAVAEGAPLGGADQRWQELQPLGELMAGKPITTVGELVACLRECPIAWWEDLRVVAEQWEAAQLAKQKQAEAEANLQAFLQGQGCQSFAQLEQDLAQARHAAAAAMLHWQQLVTKHPALPPADPNLDFLALDATYQRLREELDRCQAEVECCQERRLELQRELVSLEGQQPLNVAVAQIERDVLVQKRERCEREAHALTIAFQELRAAAVRFHETHRERLARQATAWFRELTGRPERQVHLDETFRVSWRDGDGREFAVSQLSQGAQDQLALALRLAVADLVANQVGLPLLCDDPFLNYDADRLHMTHNALQQVAKGRQVVLVSHRADLARWGHPMVVEEVAI
ncbi:MAG TPA: AAA family ATPase [Firmicutes bacterium]|jgi:DNA repair exonuclease SbcCD ATPase subunit|nr:AAA family ATPase [Bacillota bacterium]